VAETVLLLVRHAETVDNLAQRLSGWTDNDLSERGEEQVRRLADHFNQAHGHAAALYASPLIRARKTAEAIGALTGHVPIFDADLREMHFGEVDGRTLEEVRTTHAHLLEGDEDAARDDFGWPGGETRSQFVARTVDVLDRIAAAHPGQDVAVVTHGGVISTFLAVVHGQTGADWRGWLVGNASLTEVAWDPATRQGRLLRKGDDAHLAEMTAAEIWPTGLAGGDSDG
jgi:2,3-bisphosphoglycerate-dependent phosphoglycerate mutase